MQGLQSGAQAVPYHPCPCPCPCPWPPQNAASSAGPSEGVIPTTTPARPVLPLLLFRQALPLEGARYSTPRRIKASGVWINLLKGGARRAPTEAAGAKVGYGGVLRPF